MTCFKPFSQMSSFRPWGSSGQAQPGLEAPVLVVHDKQSTETVDGLACTFEYTADAACRSPARRRVVIGVA